MQYLLLIGTGALLIGSLVKNLKSFADNLRVYVAIASLPKLSQGDLQLPVKVRIDNPVAQAFKVTELFITAYKKTAQGESYLASTSPLSQPFIIKPGATTEFHVVVRLPVQDAILEAFNTLTNTSSFSASNYVLKGYIKADGISIPIDTSTQNQVPR
jgi:hypothetical protein